jgi:hypothetical protein
MACFFPYQSVGNFMQDDLFDFLRAAIFDQVAADSYYPCAKIALPRSVDCPVKSKRVVNQSVLNKELMGQVNRC